MRVDYFSQSFQAVFPRFFFLRVPYGVVLRCKVPGYAS